MTEVDLSQGDLYFDMKKPGPAKTYASTKTYDFNTGFSCCFRQWRAQSHCHFLHGYALKFHFEFLASELDEKNWAVDFGSLKSLKGWLEDMFDHTTLVAKDDPLISTFREMHIAKMIDMRIVEATGCEATARFIYEYTEQWLKDNGYGHITLGRVSVHEHSGNSAWYGIIG